MLVYKAICDSCGEEFELHQTFTVEVQETTLPDANHYMPRYAPAQSKVVLKKTYIICKGCLKKFPVPVYKLC